MSTRRQRPKQQPTGDYEVGYCRPPEEHRFPPGTSGNPKGRPKKAEGGPANVTEILTRPIQVTSQGKTKAVHPFEASLRAQIRRALDEDHLPSLLEVLKTFEAHHEFTPPEQFIAGGVINAPPGVNFSQWLEEVTEIIPVEERANNRKPGS